MPPQKKKNEKAEAARIRRQARFEVFQDAAKARKDAIKAKEAALKEKTDG